MALKENELARRDSGLVEWRADPVRIAWHFTDLATTDSHSLECRFSCSIRIADTDADRRMCAEVFLTRENSLSSEGLVQHFSRVLRSTMESLCHTCKAADAIGGFSRQKWIEALNTCAHSIAFSSGLELLPPFHLDIESPTLRRQKLEDITAARRTEHLQRATDLMKQFQTMRESAPQLSAGKLLEQLDPADRGKMLQTLLLADSTQSEPAALWAVAGSSLVRIDPRETPPRMQLHPISSRLGPLRCVQPATLSGSSVLLLGAQRGIIRITPQNPAEAICYAPAAIPESQLGFSRIACVGRQIWASHTEAGIARWQANAPETPPVIFSDVRARHLQMLDESRVIYSLGEVVAIWDGNSQVILPSHSSSPVAGIVPRSTSMVAAHEDGTLVVIDRTSARVIDTRHRGTRISAATAMPWMDETRLLLATDQGPIDCIGLDDPLVTEYLSPYRGLRTIVATRDLIAAITPDRQRIVVWLSWDGQRPIGEIHITSQTRHRVADIRFDGL